MKMYSLPFGGLQIHSFHSALLLTSSYIKKSICLRRMDY
jgi:hypothetical protein